MNRPGFFGGLGIWSLVILVNGIAGLEGFSRRRAIASMLLAFVAVLGGLLGLIVPFALLAR